jgi:hypothetical protein
MLTTKGCLIAFFNKLYGNDTLGALLDCIALPRPLPCSNCMPRFIGPLYFPRSSDQPRLVPFKKLQLPVASTASKRPTQQKLTKKMRVAAEAKLLKFRDRVYSPERANKSHGFTPRSACFNTPTISTVLDNLFQITSLDILSTTIPGNIIWFMA